MFLFQIQGETRLVDSERCDMYDYESLGNLSGGEAG